MSKQDLFDKWNNYIQLVRENGTAEIPKNDKEANFVLRDWNNLAKPEDPKFKEINDIPFEAFLEQLKELNLEEEVILRMRYEDKMSIQDIQEFFGLSESALKMRLMRAFGKIKTLQTT